MTKEQLIELGLDEDQIKEVFRLYGLVVNPLKQELEGVQGQLETAQEDLTARSQELESLKELNPEELKAQIETLQEEHTARAQEHEQQVKDLKLNSAIDLALNGVVHDIGLARTLLDREKLVIGDDDKIIGLDGQIEKLKETKGFMFVPEEPEPKPGINVVKPSAGQGQASLTKDEILAIKNPVKRIEAIQKNPDLFK